MRHRHEVARAEIRGGAKRTRCCHVLPSASASHVPTSSRNTERRERQRERENGRRCGVERGERERERENKRRGRACAPGWTTDPKRGMRERQRHTHSTGAKDTDTERRIGRTRHRSAVGGWRVRHVGGSQVQRNLEA
eukprot:365212-Chlamydomonas_euryale.AAC.4